MGRNDYYIKRNIEDIDKIGELLQELPPVAKIIFWGLNTLQVVKHV